MKCFVSYEGLSTQYNFLCTILGIHTLAYMWSNKRDVKASDFKFRDQQMSKNQASA